MLSQCNGFQKQNKKTLKLFIYLFVCLLVCSSVVCLPLTYLLVCFFILFICFGNCLSLEWRDPGFGCFEWRDSGFAAIWPKFGAGFGIKSFFMAGNEISRPRQDRDFQNSDLNF